MEHHFVVSLINQLERKKHWGSPNPLYKKAAVSLSRLVSLKLLNSIVLLGKSCVYVKRAKMEDKLFERASPSSSTENDSSKTDKNVKCHAPPGKPNLYNSRTIFMQAYKLCPTTYMVEQELLIRHFVSTNFNFFYYFDLLNIRK